MKKLTPGLVTGTGPGCARVIWTDASRVLCAHKFSEVHQEKCPSNNFHVLALGSFSGNVNLDTRVENWISFYKFVISY